MAAMPQQGLSAADAMALYRQLMGPQTANPYWFTHPVQQQPAQSPVAGIIGKVAPAAIKYGIKELLGSGGAAATASESAFPAFSIGAEAPASILNMSDDVAALGAQGASDAAGTTISNFAGSATPYLGAAGAALGTYGALKGIHEKNPLSAGMGALGAGLGINAMGFALGPAGWAAMLAAPVAGALINKHLDKDQWKTESKRLNKLKKGGTFVPENLLASMPQAGRSKGDLLNKAYAADFIGRGTGGDWVNNKFSQSRNEADLRPEDIVGYAAFAEKDKDWFNKPLADRLKVADDALKAGAVREQKGTVKVDWNKVAGALAGDSASGK